MRPDDARASRKVVTVGEYDFTIRKLASDEMVALGFFPLDAAMKLEDETLGMDAKERIAADAVSDAFGPDMPSRVNNLFAAAVIEPPIWVGPRETCPNDGVTLWVGDLAEVRDGLCKAIYEHSKLPEVLAKMSRFRDRERVGGDAVVLGGTGAVPADGPPGEPVAAGAPGERDSAPGGGGGEA
jgi:hypothetical protein